MTGDARGEAERIVTDFAAAVVDSDFVPGARWLIRDDVGAPYDRLVAALAAAIGVDDAVERDMAFDKDARKAQIRLHAALSALRARAGEGEWPSHLKAGAPYLVCDRCGRKEWAIDWDGECSMTQPDGHPCGGTLARAGEETG